MFRFVAFMWNSLSEPECARARDLSARLRIATHDLHCVLDQDGAQVYCAGLASGSTTVYQLPLNAGVLLGVLFEGKTSDLVASRKARLSARETAALLQSHGTRLTEDYWGRYVAFLTDSDSGTTRVIRSPTGEIACLHTQQHGVHIFFSSIPDITALQLQLSIDWEYVAAYLSTTMLDGTRTGLNEVSRVLHGECICVCRGVVQRQYYWHPARFALESLEDQTEAAAAIRVTARRCVHSWASLYPGILQMLSGGLDSSIVLGCLADAPTQPKITCLNYRNARDRCTDERSYARVASARVACALVERESEA